MSIIPKISIIVPVYNSEIYIERCLKSIVNQTYKNYEVIIIDDGSTDRSAVICDCFAASDSRFHVIHQKNTGVSVARNCGIAAAHGEWIMFVDSDDWLEKCALDTLLRESVYDPDIIIGGSYVHQNDSVKLFCKDTIPFAEYEVGRRMIDLLMACIIGQQDWAFIFPEDMREGPILTLPSFKLYNSRICRKITFPSGLKYSEDKIFNLKAIALSKKVRFVNAPVYNYVRNTNTASYPDIQNAFQIYSEANCAIYEVLCSLDKYQELKKPFVLNTVQLSMLLLRSIAMSNCSVAMGSEMLKKYILQEYREDDIKDITIFDLPKIKWKIFFLLFKCESYSFAVFLAKFWYVLHPLK